MPYCNSDMVDDLTACICAVAGAGPILVCVFLWSNLRSGLVSPVPVTVTIFLIAHAVLH